MQVDREWDCTQFITASLTAPSLTPSSSSDMGSSWTTAPSGDPSVFQHGVLHRLQCGSVSHGLLPMLQRNLCSSAWSTSSPYFFSDLGVYRVVALVYSHSSLSQPSVWHYFSLFSQLSAKMPPSGLWVQLCSRPGVLELPGTGCAQHQGTCTQCCPQKLDQFLPILWNFFKILYLIRNSFKSVPAIRGSARNLTEIKEGLST